MEHNLEDFKKEIKRVEAIFFPPNGTPLPMDKYLKVHRQFIDYLIKVEMCGEYRQLKENRLGPVGEPFQLKEE